MRKSVTLVVSLVCLAALIGCSNDTRSGPPLAIDGQSSAAVPGTSESPGDSSPSGRSTRTSPVRPDEKGHEVVPARLSVKGEAGTAVAEAWLAYWQVRLDAFFAAELDPTALGEVATNDAADQVISYVTYLRQKSLHTLGDIQLGVSAVKIKGNRATLRSCALNRTTDRRSDGSKAESLNPFLIFLGELKRSGGNWRVSDVSIYARTAC